MLSRFAIALGRVLLLLRGLSALPVVDLQATALLLPSESFARSVDDSLALQARASGAAARLEGRDHSNRLKSIPPEFEWTELGSPARAGHVAVLDARHRRLVVFGGRVAEKYQRLENRNDVWVLKLNGEPEWEQIAPLGTPPTPRAEASGVFDADRERLLVFGGKDSSGLLNDVWELSLKGRPRWRQLNHVGPLWSRRFRHSTTLDQANNRVILFGGEHVGDDGFTYTNDLWQLDLSSLVWTRLTVNGPVPPRRAAHSAILAAGRKQLVVYGGASPVLCPGPFTCPQNRTDIWALSLTLEPYWTELTPPPVGRRPCGIQHHSASYDPVEDRMLVVGGYAAYGADEPCFGGIAQTWAFSFRDVQWSLVDGGQGPRARYFTSSLFDDEQGRVLVYGGGGGTPYADVWALTLRPVPAWKRLAPVDGVPPPWSEPRALHYDTENDLLLTASDGRLWSHGLRHGETWTLSEVVGALPRFYSAVEVLDVPSRRLVRHGIVQGGKAETWQLSLEGPHVWSRLATEGEGPALFDNSGVLDPIRQRMIVIGGLPSWPPTNDDVWSLSLGANPRWTKLTVEGSWRSRAGHSLIYDPVGDRIVVFGGGGPDSDSWWTLNDVWALSLSDTPGWTELATNGWGTELPYPRAFHASFFDPIGNRMIMAGGWVPGAFARGPFDDAWEFRLGNSSWHRIEPEEALPLWRSPQSAFDSRRNRMVLFEYDWLWAIEPVRRHSMKSPGSVSTEEIKPAKLPQKLSTVMSVSASNPFADDLVVEMVLPSAASATLELFDVTGRRVWRKAIEPNAAGHLRIRESHFDGLHRGVYLLKLTQSKDSRMTRLVHLP